MNCMLVLVFYTSIQAFTLITTNVSKWGRSGRLFLVSMLGLTDSESFYLGTMRQNELFRGLRFSFHREIQEGAVAGK